MTELKEKIWRNLEVGDTMMNISLEMEVASQQIKKVLKVNK